jgi:predicted nicotinamide N-methyase
MIENPELTEKLSRVLKDARIVAAAMPLTPEIQLYLLSREFPRRPLTEEERRLLMDEPPFWAFCWSSGQVLAQWIRSSPETVYGKRILDFGSGSGIAAIAAAVYGASEVFALDTDPMALEAIRANAGLNHVHINVAGDLHSLQGRFDVILAADVLYDRNNLQLLNVFIDLAYRTVVADSRVKELPDPYKEIGSGTAVTFPDLDEPDEFRDVALFAFPV